MPVKRKHAARMAVESLESRLTPTGTFLVTPSAGNGYPLQRVPDTAVDAGGRHPDAKERAE